MEFKKVAILGGGVLGTQIAMQSAYCGKEVAIWLRSEDSKTRTQPKLERLYGVYEKTLEQMNKTRAQADFCGGLAASYDTFDYTDCVKRAQDAKNHITLTTDMAEAVKDADIIIEATAEIEKEKIGVFQAVAKVLKKDQLLVTNSSSLLPSKFTKYVPNKKNYLALHFANNIWKQNITEVMRTADTGDEAFQAAARFSKEINMVPSMILKEKAGYILNTLLIPLLSGSMELIAHGYATPEDVDRTWRTATGAPYGPCEIYDVVGLDTGYNIVKKYVHVPKFIAGYDFKAIAKLLEGYKDAGKTGVNAGEGFFKYDEMGHRLNGD